VFHAGLGSKVPVPSTFINPGMAVAMQISTCAVSARRSSRQGDVWRQASPVAWPK
jgi:hypothetical protein